MAQGSVVVKGGCFHPSPRPLLAQGEGSVAVQGHCLSDNNMPFRLFSHHGNG